MKKSVMLMVGILAVALAGSAQAAGNVMFAVQNAGGTDMATISDLGDVAANKISSGLNATNVPLYNPATTVGQGVIHAASSGTVYTTASNIFQHVALVNAASVFPAVSAPNFSFYRINRDSAGNYVLPGANANLGYFNFGTLNTTVDPNLAAARKNLAQFTVSAEGATAANPNAWTSLTDNPVYFSWTTTHNSGTPSFTNALTEKMRLTSQGNLGIGTIAPTSKLHVVGLPVAADNAAALAAGLTAGAIYTDGAGALKIVF